MAAAAAAAAAGAEAGQADFVADDVARDEVSVLFDAMCTGVNRTGFHQRPLTEIAAKVRASYADSKSTRLLDYLPERSIQPSDFALAALAQPSYFPCLYVNALASLRSTSAFLSSKKLTYREVEHPFKVERTEVDVLVIGSGAHEQIFQNTLKFKQRSELRVLTVNDDPYVSSNFHNADTRVVANSSTRASLRNVEINQPGRGNINNFPNGRLQLSVVSSSKYQVGGGLDCYV